MTHHGPILPAAPLDGAPLDQPSDERTPPRPGERWTPPKMADFLRQLSATHSVSAAARSVGMSRQAAYRLRSRLKGKPFDLAWDVAFHHSYDNLAHAALERALNGVEMPVFFAGEQVGSYRRFDERLTIALLAMSTQRGNAPVLGRHAAEAERHAGRFDALVAEVAAGEGGGGGEGEGEGRDGDKVDLAAPPDPPGEVFRLRSVDLSPMSDADILAQLRALDDEHDG